jgi:hypothetical protein
VGPTEERARVLDNLSVVLRDLGDPVAAEASARRALADWLKLRGHDDVDTATSMAALGAALLAQVDRESGPDRASARWRRRRVNGN